MKNSVLTSFYNKIQRSPNRQAGENKRKIILCMPVIGRRYDGNVHFPNFLLIEFYL